MCWSGEASAAVAGIGLVSSVYAIRKKEHPVLYLSLIYFSLMETLQAYTYTVIDKCNEPANQVATLLGYLHLTFQPFFINAISLYFVPPQVRKKVEIVVYSLCFIGVFVMLVQLYPFDWAGRCATGRPLCGPVLCSVSGNWHIAWSIPTNDIGNFFHRLGFQLFRSGFVAYTLTGFILPMLYGSWRFTIYHLLMGPLLANLLSDNPIERPAIWCLLSFGILILVVDTPLRKVFYVKNYKTVTAIFNRLVGGPLVKV